jgi:hypothetical protein
MSAAHSRYPLRMMHPNYWPGYVGREIVGAAGIKYFEGGLPARFPPVTVNTEDQEEEHISKGYVPAGNSDPAAYAAAIANVRDGYAPEEYPKWVNGELAMTREDEERILSGEPIPVEEDELTRLRRENAELMARTEDERDLEIKALKRANEELAERLGAALRSKIVENLIEQDDHAIIPEELSPPTSVNPPLAEPEVIVTFTPEEVEPPLLEPPFAILENAPVPPVKTSGQKAWETRKKREIERMKREAEEAAEAAPPDAA